MPSLLTIPAPPRRLDFTRTQVFTKGSSGHTVRVIDLEGLEATQQNGNGSRVGEQYARTFLRNLDLGTLVYQGLDGSKFEAPQPKSLLIITPPAQEPDKRPDQGIKQAKTGSIGSFEEPEEPIDEEHLVWRFKSLHTKYSDSDRAAFFKNYEVVGISLETGIVVRSKVEPGVLVVVKARHFLPKGDPILMPDGISYDLTSIKRGRQQGSDDIEATMTRYRNASLMPKYADALRYLKEAGADFTALQRRKLLLGIGMVGWEREYIVADPKTGEYKGFWEMRPDEQGVVRKMLFKEFEELFIGMGEVVEGQADRGHKLGIFTDPIEAVIESAFTREWLEERYPGALVMDIGMPPSGTPKNTVINATTEHESGMYLASIASQLMVNFKPGTEASIRFREKQALKYGFITDDGQPDVSAMIRAYADKGLWPPLAGHMSSNTGNHLRRGTNRFETDLEMVINQGNLFGSLGKIVRVMTATGPLVQDLVADWAGKPLYDARNAFRNDMGSAPSYNEPIKDVRHFEEIGIQTITEGKADRLGRAFAVQTKRIDHPDGRVEMVYTPMHHGDIRYRIEMTQNGSVASARIEFTGAGASDSIARGRGMSVLQMLTIVSLMATVHEWTTGEFGGEHTALKYVAKMLWNDPSRWQEVWDTSNEFVFDYMTEGPQSLKTQKLANLLIDLFTKVAIQVPGMEKIKNIAVASLNNLSVDGTFDDLSQGRGNLATAVVNLVNDKAKGYNNLQMAHIIDAFESQQARFLRDHQDQPDVIYDHYKGNNNGNAGFDFDWPDVSHLADEAA